MRHKLPILWIFQIFLLTGIGLMCLLAPKLVLEFKRGQIRPIVMQKPTRALNEWVLGLETIPAPNETVREFFSTHDQVAYADTNLWTPGDPSLDRFDGEQSSAAKWKKAAELNQAWEQFEQWLLSARPAPPKKDRPAIQAWLSAIDQVPAPSKDLRDRIKNQNTAIVPPKGLRMMILDAKQNLPVSWQMAADQTQMSAPCILGAAIFTLFGLLTPSIRRPLARVFVFVFLFWAVAALKSSLGPWEVTLKHGVLLGGLISTVILMLGAIRNTPGRTAASMLCLILSAWWIAMISVAALSLHEQGSMIAKRNMVIATTIMSLLGVINANYWLVGKSEDPPQDNAGIAQRRPPHLWSIWSLQFLILFFSGLLALTFPIFVSSLFAGSQFDYLATDIVHDSVRSLGAWTIAIGLFSYFALGVARDWIWQGLCVVFCIIFVVLAFGAILHGLSGKYSLWQYGYILYAAIFVPTCLFVLWQHDPWSTENVERVRKEDWSPADLLNGINLMWRPMITARRAVFREGVGLQGTMTMLPTTKRGHDDDVGVPPDAFFAAGKQFPVQVRFSNRTQADDASMDIRGFAMRLSTGDESPLDLLFATGAYAPMGHVLDFWRLRRNLRRSVQKHKVIREGLAAGMRRAPESYAALTYFHQLTLEWATLSADHYLVRFRIIPAAKGEDQIDPEQIITDQILVEESQRCGLPDTEDLQHLWQQHRRPDEWRTDNYLRRDLRKFVDKGNSVEFLLQAQFHRPDRGDSLDWYNASIEWDTRRHRWYSIAKVTLDKPMSDEACERMHVDPSNLPTSLAVPRTDNVINIFDPRSLASSRHRIASVLGQLRRWRGRDRQTDRERKRNLEPTRTPA